MRQGCPLSPILFNIYINDLEVELRRKRDGGTVLSPGLNTKIYALLYADDAAIVAENKEELDKMIRNLEIWTDKNLMEVNVEITKIVVLGNGGRRKKKPRILVHGYKSIQYTHHKSGRKNATIN